jgi:deoxyribodipyrimidine photo-lyase
MNKKAAERSALAWFRRDLRLHDHPALTAAVEYGRVACLYVLDDRLLDGRFASPNRAWFLHESLLELRDAVEARGGTFIVRRGRAEQVVPSVTEEVGASAVFVSRDFGAFGRRRDARVREKVAERGVAFHEHPGVVAVEPEQLAARAGADTAFGPFFRRWLTAPHRDPVAPPEVIAGVRGSAAIREDDAWEPTRPRAQLLPGGEQPARQRLEAWLRDGIGQYGPLRDRLDKGGTSRLSQDLRWGLLSPAEVIARAAAEGPNKFVEEVAWRDYYHHLAWHAPAILRAPFRAGSERLPWMGEGDAAAAWREGRTGYPVVDAAMRQLVATGWMHNRARMVTASFLTKNLFVDYGIGEAFFMRHLADGDPAINNGGWQWAASTGAGAPPYFRSFNPVRQGQRFDPDGTFVRRWLPELRDVPDVFVHEPWAMPADVQQRAGCVIGRDYPAPIVPLSGARERLRAFYTGAS